MSNSDLGPVRQLYAVKLLASWAFAFGFGISWMGCGKSELDHLEHTYKPPELRGKNFRIFRPHPKSKAANLLKKGENKINLREKYLTAHHDGWKTAFLHWRIYKEFKINKIEDSYSVQSDLNEWYE